ncbi:HGL318Cp [Eremothecium sinecaudum]|uniref:Kinase n=1 Tax=Eremothecium sinecaudum TaxID=45286 RepID=A0A109UZY6_9SACH|nr:HGL318Cp [Eremothecium sinecaudum]AMD22022.1 HGL318Cp [Eremothecium sinecaudum]
MNFKEQQETVRDTVVAGKEHNGLAESTDEVQGHRVLHGRKASTFLGIFDNSPPIDGITGKKQSDGSDGEEKSNAEELLKKKKKKKKRENELALLAECEEVGDVRICKPGTGYPVESVEQQDLELYTDDEPTPLVFRESVSKPISSAIYYPHKLKDEQLSALHSLHSESLLPQSQQSVQSEATEGVPTDISLASQSNYSAVVDSEDEDNALSSDETQEFPLKVELQPFTDNVGGHTAIFRFSERAVCKALVNRENSWYETIELKHPGLLQFMPRYIGVLNVRQHFNSKEEFLNHLSAKKTKLYNTIASPEAIDETLRHNHLDRVLSPEIDPIEQISSPQIVEETPLPEVCLDDNKHIIPDSLWCRYSHSPSSVPSEDSLLNSRHNSGSNLLTKARGSGNLPLLAPNETGSTLVNTRLKELVIEEVFGQPTVASKSQQNLQHTGRSQFRQIIHHMRHSSNPNDNGGKIRIQSSDCLTNVPANKQSRSSSTSSSAAQHSSRKKRQDSRNSLVDLREIKQGICADKSELFAEDDDSSALSVANSPKSRPQHTAHESISYEEQSHTVVSKFILLEDLTRKLNKPCVLDLKMGTRQYGVDAKRSKQLSQREKCRNTTSRKLGVRICGLKIWNKDYYITRDKYFGRRVKIGWQFVRILARFLYDGMSNRSILKQIPFLIKQLDTLHNEAAQLKSYRMYGASLLLMYDGNNSCSKRCKVKLNLIDFARCVTKKDMDTSIDTFKIRPKNPELEDRGFLRGLKSLKFYLLVIWNHLTSDHPLVYEDDELMEYLDSVSEFQTAWEWVDEFEKENESRFNDPSDELRKKWRKYELIFDVEPVYGDDDVSE